MARKISDRHFGVGSDGLILICQSQQADARMRMFNADGSESEMCGNGIRCVAKYVYDHGICRNETLQIETGRGILVLKLEVADGRVRRVCVDMGKPILEPARIPAIFRIRTTAIGSWISRLGSTFHSVAAKLGWRLRVGSADDLRFDGQPACGPLSEVLETGSAGVLGPFMETQPIFPKRINVHSCKSTARAK